MKSLTLGHCKFSFPNKQSLADTYVIHFRSWTIAFFLNRPLRVKMLQLTRPYNITSCSISPYLYAHGYTGIPAQTHETYPWSTTINGLLPPVWCHNVYQLQERRAHILLTSQLCVCCLVAAVALLSILASVECSTIVNLLHVVCLLRVRQEAS